MASTSKSKRATKKSSGSKSERASKPAGEHVSATEVNRARTASEICGRAVGDGVTDDAPAINFSRATEVQRNSTHSSSNIRVVIRGLESLSETLPAVLQVANGIAPQGVMYTSRDTLISAINILRAFRNHREAREMESDGKMITEALAEATTKGIALGIEQEKQRVKEARRGRK